MATQLSGIHAIADAFDAFLIDQVGVLHDGRAAYLGAAAALRRLRAAGAPIAIVSNSGKRAAPNRRRLLDFGFDGAAIDEVVTSGECARATLESWLNAGRLRPGAGVMLFSRDGDTALIDGLDLRPCADPDEVGLLVIAGARPDEVSFDAYARAMQSLAARGVPALCANPDQRIFARGAVAFGPGALAEHYARQGGAVSWIGKPDPAIFHRALADVGGPEAGRTLVIGDSPAHDGDGAARAGCPWLFVRGGVYANTAMAGGEAPVSARFTIATFTW